jgi:hypothetical protein
MLLEANEVAALLIRTRVRGGGGRPHSGRQPHAFDDYAETIDQLVEDYEAERLAVGYELDGEETDALRFLVAGADCEDTMEENERAGMVSLRPKLAAAEPERLVRF